MPRNSASRAGRAPDWLAAHLVWITGPSWLLSVVLHAALLTAILFLAQSPGCRAVRGEQADDSGREVGIVSRTAGVPGSTAQAPRPRATGEQPEPTRSTLAPRDASSPPRLDSSPPVALSLPEAPSPSFIGIGAPAALPGLPSGAASLAGAPGARRDGGGGGGPGAGGQNGAGETAMFGVPAQGRRFVYVIDRSSSMERMLRLAKAELQASLERLDATQQFQVVLFNQEPVSLRSRFDLFFGNDVDRRDVAQQLQGFSATGGTRREEALLHAFEFRPDVVYFLTDIENPLSPAEIQSVLRRRGRAQLHCIEFGEGPEPLDGAGRPYKNFLHTLAAGSGGLYAYRSLDALAP